MKKYWWVMLLPEHKWVLIESDEPMPRTEYRWELDSKKKIVAFIDEFHDGSFIWHVNLSQWNRIGGRVKSSLEARVAAEAKARDKGVIAPEFMVAVGLLPDEFEKNRDGSTGLPV